MYPKIRFIIIYLVMITHTTYSCRNGIAHDIPFTQVVVWGHKLGTHTHSYIHWAFARTFKHLGYPVYWLDNTDDISTYDLSHSLFITEGQVDQKIPLRTDSWYITHNCAHEKYKWLHKQGHAIALEVYSTDCLKHSIQKLEPYIWYNLEKHIIYMPWATDLLPHEIDTIKQQLPTVKKERAVRFIGSRWGGWQGNLDAIDNCARACRHNKISFELIKNVAFEDHIRLVQTALVAPAIQGNWQCEHGYIPCRIFKNISYGNYGVTNSKTVYELFDKKILYHENTYTLMNQAFEYINHVTLADQYTLMDFVRDKHTYINRIDSLLTFLSMVQNQSKVLLFIKEWALGMPCT
jgi:hypothetical protein